MTPTSNPNSSTTHGSSQAESPGKIILVGEHSVVYGQPAIAVPVWEATATAVVSSAHNGSGCVIVARDLECTIPLAQAPADDPLALIVRKTLSHVGHLPNPDWQIEISSTIPIASGLGSGAAVSAAIIRAICNHVGYPIEDVDVSQLVYEGEVLHHGTPSGIDNTVIAYGMPVWYVKGNPPVPFTPATPLTLVIGNSGITAPTKESVGDVRKGWQEDTLLYESIFDQIGRLVSESRGCIESGNEVRLGKIFDENHSLLCQLKVSHPRLDVLVNAARSSGALGAKLSGGGRGGNMIALVRNGDVFAVETALVNAGAQAVLVTRI